MELDIYIYIYIYILQKREDIVIINADKGGAITV